MTERDRFAHLAGYASITAVLATAEWAGMSAVLLAAPIVLGTLYIGGQMLVSRLVERARERTSPATQPDTTDVGSERAARADGGREVRR